MAKILFKASPKTGDPKKPADASLQVAKGKIDQELDIRDRLAELVGKGNALNADDKMAIYGDLTNLLGKERAQKIINHAFIFNARPDVQKLPLEQKLQSFYTIGSNDPDVDNLIKKSKSLGYGVVPGFRQSSSAINQVLSGQVPLTAGPPAPDNAETRRKIMLAVGK